MELPIGPKKCHLCYAHIVRFRGDGDHLKGYICTRQTYKDYTEPFFLVFGVYPSKIDYGSIRLVYKPCLMPGNNMQGNPINGLGNPSAVLVCEGDITANVDFVDKWLRDSGVDPFYIEILINNALKEEFPHIE